MAHLWIGQKQSKNNSINVPLCLFFSRIENSKNSTVAMAMQRFFEFFRRKNYSALWHNLLNRFYKN